MTARDEEGVRRRREYAERYVRVGMEIIQLPPGAKNPNRKGWPEDSVRLEDIPRLFANLENIGAKLGEPSGGLVDVDLDREEARAAGRLLLPETRTFGRQGKTHGHAAYYVEGGIPPTRRFEVPDGFGGVVDGERVLVELRSTGCQTIVPPSDYPDGDRCVWGPGRIARIRADGLVRAVEDTAVAASLVMRYPGAGSRHEYALCVAGYLLRGGLTPERVRRILEASARVAGDPEVDDRLKAVETTRQRLAAGGKVKGGQQLEKLVPGVPGVMRGWLRLGEAEEDGLPLVRVGSRPLRHKTADALQALDRADARIYVRGDHLARVVLPKEDAPEGVGREGPGPDEDEPMVQVLDEARLRHHLARAANFVRGSSEEGYVHVSPPRDVVQDMLSCERWPFPGLIGVSRVPFLRPTDGSLIARSGYDPVTGVYCAPPAGLRVEVPEMPSQGEVRRALGLVAECVHDFPFRDEASAANALGLLLTPVLRTAIPGCVPLAVLDKPTPGTGGSLLSEVVSLVALGGPAAMMSHLKHDDEARKQITSVLLAGDGIVVIDNVEGELSLPSLARAITAERWRDRLLGHSKIVTVPQLATWVASGNNLKLGGDLARRAYWIRLDAMVAKPWERRGFRHPDLKAWVHANRGDLLSALLILGRAWFAEGCPEPGGLPALGGFAGWRRVVGGVLEVAGVRGFLSNLEEMYERSGGDDGEWEAFLAAWRDSYAEEPVRTSRMAEDLLRGGDNPLRDALPEQLLPAVVAEDPGLSRKLGNAFAAREDRRHGSSGLHLARAGTHKRAVLWAARAAPPDGGRGVSLESLVSPPGRVTGSRDVRNGRVANESGAGDGGDADSRNSSNSPAGEAEPQERPEGAEVYAWQGEF